MKTYKQFAEEKSLRTSNPCWTGYHPVGTKKKGGRTVPNCVPEENQKVDENHIAIAMGKMLDDEGSMVLNQLDDIERCSKMIRDYVGNDTEKQLPAWVQSKVTLAADYINTVGTYLSTTNEAVVVEGAPIVVMPSPARLKKAEPTKVRYQGDIVPPTKPPSTEKRGVKGRPGQRPMPEQVVVEELEGMFDIVEELVMEIAEFHNIDPEQIWEDLADVSDEELFESAAWRRSEGKDPKGGLNRKGIASYRRENPGSKLSMAVTTKPSKLKPGSKAANRRKSFCARMGGMKGSMKKPNGKPSRKALALRKWNC